LPAANPYKGLSLCQSQKGAEAHWTQLWLAIPAAISAMARLDFVPNLPKDKPFGKFNRAAPQGDYSLKVTLLHPGGGDKNGGGDGGGEILLMPLLLLMLS